MPLNVVSLVDSLADALRQRMFDGTIEPGTRLVEESIADEYEVSRPSARAAIERLASEGLAERSAHKGARVPVMDARQVRDMYFARSLIENQCYRILASRRTLPAGVDALMTEMRQAAETGNLVEFVEADVRFHVLLVRELGSSRIERIHGNLINEMRLCLAQVQASRLLDPAQIIAEHAALLRAIRAGKPDVAVTRGERHLDHARNALCGFLERDPAA